MNNAYKGVYTAITTPFNKDESIDFGAIKTLVEYQVEAGVDGLLVLGNTGEYTMMTADERKAVVKAYCEAAAGRLKIVATSNTNWTEGTLDFVRANDDYGVDFHLVTQPYDTVTSKELMFGYYEEICATAKAGVVIHNNMNFSSLMSPEMVYQLAQLEGMAGVKDVAPFEHNHRVLQLCKDMDTFSVFVGYEDSILANLCLGVAGCMGDSSLIVPQFTKGLYEACQRGDMEKAREYQWKIDTVCDAINAEPFPSGVKYALELMGLPGGIARRPLGPASEAQKKNIKAALQQVGII